MGGHPQPLDVHSFQSVWSGPELVAATVLVECHTYNFAAASLHSGHRRYAGAPVSDDFQANRQAQRSGVLSKVRLEDDGVRGAATAEEISRRAHHDYAGEQRR